MLRNCSDEFDGSSSLDVDEFERLQDVLARDPAWMNVETLDGYFAALVCAPEQASTGLRFGPVFGGDVFADAALGDDAGWVECSLRRHWRTIEATLHSALEDPLLEYRPLLLEEANGTIAGNDWARGFLLGVADDAESWAGFERAQEAALEAVRRLAAEPAAHGRYSDTERNALVAEIAAMLVAAYRYFEPIRG